MRNFVNREEAKLNLQRTKPMPKSPEQIADELAEKVAKSIRDSVDHQGYILTEPHLKSAILTTLNLRDLVEAQMMLSKFADMVWESRQDSDDEDYVQVLGIAAEIRSGNRQAIKQAMEKGE